MNAKDFFNNYSQALVLYEYFLNEIKGIGSFTISVTKSQIALKRQKTFAILWIPARYLKGKFAPLVLTLSLPTRHPSTRWKEIVEISPRHYTHHLEIFSIEDIDDEVCDWVFQAWENSA